MTPIRFHLLKVGHCSHPECVAMRGGRWSSLRFPALCGVIEHAQRGVILFDTGYSPHFFDATQPFPERAYRWITPVTLAPEETLVTQLARLGIAASEVRHVIISHYHGDHIAGVKDFPMARFWSTRTDFDALRKRSRLGNLFHACLPALLPADFATRLDFVEEARRMALPREFHPFDSGFDLFGDASVAGIPLPGHSAGQLGIAFCRADGRPVFLVADACWTRNSLDEDRPATWIASRIFDSRDEYHATFRKLRALSARDTGVAIVPSHCDLTWEAWPNALA
jgi:glyoxylase-like metal-dependent hydrolase (beta-lactamase superfamily II)